MSVETVVLERKPYEPWVTEQDDHLTYHLPVESGFASLLFKFSITSDQLTILEADEERYYFLFAVLHRRYQMQNPASAPNTDRHFNLILFPPTSEVERLLNLEDAEGNGAVSNLIRITMGRDQKKMRNGSWFIDR